MKAIIPAAGFGTRFLPATKAQPKEMLPIVDKPTIQFVVEEAVASGIEDILIITGSKKRAIEDHFDKCFELENHLKKHNKHEELKQIRELSDLIDIHYIRQKEQLGLGHAVLCAKKHLHNEAFAVLLGDDIIDSTTPCTKQLIDCHKKTNSSVIGIEEVPLESVYKYGIVSGLKINDNTYEIQKMVEKPHVEEAPGNLAIIGRYILNPEIFDSL
ncbi:MAG: UTP--glucose-1-phosphate uridylyltransferase GalU, partial [Candidatus Diapherotrites archaeon]|nr:UTP--glucose-1-phosphate uridylyltransferase GalU [Candidatus Diapherotrites archaeon]